MFLDLLRRAMVRRIRARLGTLARVDRLRSSFLRYFRWGLPSVLLAVAVTAPALAVPSFAIQTGQPCAACHIGAFGRN
jgi:hypothetical protein